MQQIPLTVGLPKVHSFTNFYSVPANHIVVNTLKQLLQDDVGSVVGLQGASGTGKSHLLQAVVSASNHAMYIPLGEVTSPDVFADLESFELVALDDIDSVFAKPEWEQALFHFYNRLIDAGGKMVFASNTPLSASNLQLPDLMSRLKLGLLFNLAPLCDEDKQAAFAFRAKDLGIELSDELIKYVFRHTNRDMPSLIRLLNQLDQMSLTHKRKPSVPLLKELLLG